MKSRTKRLLNNLGDTADAVATSLQQKGIRGFRRKSGQCPITNFLIQQKAARWCWTGGKDIFYSSFWLGVKEEVDLPRAVQAFIYRFDKGGYPYLEK